MQVILGFTTGICHLSLALGLRLLACFVPQLELTFLPGSGAHF